MGICLTNLELSPFYPPYWVVLLPKELNWLVEYCYEGVGLLQGQVSSLDEDEQEDIEELEEDQQLQQPEQEITSPGDLPDESPKREQDSSPVTLEKNKPQDDVSLGDEQKLKPLPEQEQSWEKDNGICWELKKREDHNNIGLQFKKYLVCDKNDTFWQKKLRHWQDTISTTTSIIQHPLCK